jgi:hypothetical protein
MMKTNLTALVCLLLAGCGWDEGLLIQNLHGRVFISKDLLTREVLNEDGTTSTIGPDVRLIGPVYLGLYSGILPANTIERYPYPEVGPQYLEDVGGNTYPYGGTTIGDLRYPCLSNLVCKLTSGRFVDYDSMVTWFNGVGQPIVDESNQPVTDGAYLQQTCFQLLDVTSDKEVRLTAYEDVNGDGKLDEKDLDFVDNGDGYYAANFTIWQQQFYWDQNQENCTPGTDCKGFSLWGWMDAPAVTDYSFSTCDPDSGFLNTWYNSNFQGGAAFVDTLNFPSTYVAAGDVAATEGYEWDDIYAEPDLYLDFVVQ